MMALSEMLINIEMIMNKDLEKHRKHKGNVPKVVQARTRHGILQMEIVYVLRVTEKIILNFTKNHTENPLNLNSSHHQENLQSHSQQKNLHSLLQNRQEQLLAREQQLKQ